MKREMNLSARRGAGTHEGRVRQEHYILPLRKGGSADVRSALAFLNHADIVRRRSFDHFQSLIAIAEGRLDEASPEGITYLKRIGILDKDGGLSPEDRDVFRSSFEIVGDGPHFSMPFDLQAAGATEVITWVQREMDRSIQDFLRGIQEGRGT